MSKEKVSFKNRDRFIQLGIAISILRKLRGMSQEQLAEKAEISRSHLSANEAPGMVRAFSMEVFFNIADALETDPADLISASFFCRVATGNERVIYSNIINDTVRRGSKLRRTVSFLPKSEPFFLSV